MKLNSSFDRWPSPARFASWRTRLPAGFAMSVKAPRGLTQSKKLYAPEQGVMSGAGLPMCAAGPGTGGLYADARPRPQLFVRRVLLGSGPSPGFHTHTA